MNRCEARTDVFGRCAEVAGHHGQHRNSLGEEFCALNPSAARVPASQEELEKVIRLLPTYAVNFHGTEFGGLIERDKVLAALQAAAVHPQGWQPIETAQHGVRCFFWVVPKSADECPTNTSGEPITALGHEPHRTECKWGWWGALWKPTHWMPLPAAPSQAETPEAG